MSAVGLPDNTTPERASPEFVAGPRKNEIRFFPSTVGAVGGHTE